MRPDAGLLIARCLVQEGRPGEAATRRSSTTRSSSFARARRATPRPPPAPPRNPWRSARRGAASGCGSFARTSPSRWTGRPSPSSPAARRDATPAQPARWPVYAAASVSALGFVSFVSFGVASEVIYSGLESRCAPSCTAADRSEADRGRAYQTIANVSLAVGLVFAAAAAVLHLTRRGGAQ